MEVSVEPEPESQASSGKAERCPDTGVVSGHRDNAAGRRLGPAQAGQHFHNTPWDSHAQGAGKPAP